MVIWHDAPASEWIEADPIGNGQLGAMVFGGTHEEQIQFNHDTLFTGEPHDYAHKGAVQYLETIRQLLFNGHQQEAEELSLQEFMSVNRNGGIRQEAYQPFGDLYLQFYDHETVQNYRRELDIDQALSLVRYDVNEITYRREVFASNPANAIVMRIQTEHQLGTISCTIKLSSSHGGNTTVLEEDNSLVMAGQGVNGTTRFEARLVARVTGGTAKFTDKGTIDITEAETVTLILVGASSFVNFRDNSGDPSRRNDVILENLSESSYETLRAAHVKDYQDLFQRVQLHLGSSLTSTKQATLPITKRLQMFGPEKDPQLVTLLFQYGRYLLIASSRPGCQPANLQGLWNKRKQPPWESKYTININIQMNYWITEVTNLAECHEPLFDAMTDLAQSGAIVAKEHYGARGWVVHNNFDLWRGAAPVNNVHSGIWVTGGAWLCQHLWWHYEFSGDQEFLARTAYPLMKGAALFFVDYLVEDPESKWLISGPSDSPEHGGLVMGPTIDHQIIRYLLRKTVLAAKELGVDPDLQSQFADVAACIAPNQIGSIGQIREWVFMENPNTTHRHLSPLWGLHPGDEIHPLITPDLAEASRVVLRLRSDGGTGWSKAWKINMWARMLDGDHAFKILAEALRNTTYINLFNANTPFQIDGNFGAAAAIPEMLLQSHLGELHILPALPQAWPQGSVIGLRARGGVEVDIAWNDGLLSNVTLHASQSRRLRLRVPAGVQITQIWSSTSHTVPTTALDSVPVSFDVVSGQIYEVRIIPVGSAKVDPASATELSPILMIGMLFVVGAAVLQLHVFVSKHPKFPLFSRTYDPCSTEVDDSDVCMSLT